MTASLRALSLLLLTVSAVAADGEPKRPGPPAPPPPGDGKGGPFNSFRGPRPGVDPFAKLPEADRKRVRTAIEDAWLDPEVSAAREKCMQANEELRAAVHKAVKAKNPEVAAIIEKFKPQPPFNPEAPDFRQQAVERLLAEHLTFFTRPEQREAAKRLHERLLVKDVIKPLVDRLGSAPLPERLPAFRALREAYEREARAEIAAYRARHEAGAPDKK